MLEGRNEPSRMASILRTFFSSEATSPFADWYMYKPTKVSPMPLQNDRVKDRARVSHLYVAFWSKSGARHSQALDEVNFLSEPDDGHHDDKNTLDEGGD